MNVEIELPTLVKRRLAPQISRWDPRTDGRLLTVQLLPPLRPVNAPGGKLTDETPFSWTLHLKWELKEDAVGNRRFVVSPADPATAKLADTIEAELARYAL